jgi:hypothetical protein
MKFCDNLITCCAGIVGCRTVTAFVSMGVIFALFDLICFGSLFYSRYVYDKCAHSDIPIFVTMYLVTPYMFLNKGRIIRTITSVQSIESESSDVLVNFQEQPMDSFLEWILSAILFFWGMNEFKVSCVKNINHTWLYVMAMIITIGSGIFCIFGLLLFCCGVVTGKIREDPNVVMLRDYKLVANLEQDVM